jgi:hypothetical protein
MAKDKGTSTTERVLGSAAGVNADGTPINAHEKVRQLQQEQLRLVREQIKLFKEEENRLMKELSAYPLPGQLPLIKE